MYENLVKRLRTAQTLAEFVAEETAKTPNTIFGEAADAIEELQDALGRKEHFDSLAEQNCKQTPSVRGVIVSANHGITYVGYDEPKPQQPKEEKYGMNVELLEYPTEKDWMEVKRRALVTIGKRPISAPTDEWKREILRARHSPIRYLRFSFLITDLPSWVSVHLCRHVHAQPYVKSQRNDRQTEYDRNGARQDAPVDMIWDINGEELCVVANKRLCKMASPETQMVVAAMCAKVGEQCPEFKPFLVPMCEYTHGCNEMNGGCGRWVR